MPHPPMPMKVQADSFAPSKFDACEVGEDDTMETSIPSLPATAKGISPRKVPPPGPMVKGADGEPLVYPAPLFVRNTFIDVHTDRAPSMDGFFAPRDAVSCPTSKLSQMGSGCDDVRERAIGLNIRPAASKSAGPDDTRSECSTADTADYYGERVQQMLAPMLLTPEEPREEPEEELIVGSPECPSVGSRGHGKGDCKPCAFIHHKGCGSGVDCKFCHLCDAGEKKKRQKEKRQFFGAMRAMERAALAEEAELAAQALEGAALAAATGEELLQQQYAPLAYTHCGLEEDVAMFSTMAPQDITLESFVAMDHSQYIDNVYANNLYAMPR